MKQNNILENLFVYLFYFYPFFLIVGSFVNNIFHLLIFFFSIFLFFKKKVYFSENQRITLILLFILFIYSFSNTILNQNYEFVKNTFFFLKIISFIIVLNFFLKIKVFNFNLFFFINLLILIIVIFDTFFQYKYGQNILGYSIEPVNKIRLTSFFKDEYVVGSFISKIFLPIAIFLYFFFQKKNYKHKDIFFIFFLIIINLSIFISGERAAILTFFVSLFFLFLFVKEFRKILIIQFLLCVFVISVTLYFTPSLKTRYIKSTFNNTLNINSDKSIYDSQYGAIFLSSLEIFKKNILFGNGLRSYRVISCNPNSYLEIKNSIKDKTNHANFICSTHPHNYVLELLIDLGLVGFFLFLLLIFDLIKKIFSLLNTKDIIYADKILIISFGIQFLSLFWPISTHGSIFSSWNSSFIIVNYSFFISSVFFLKK